MVFPGTIMCRVMSSFHSFMFFIHFSIYCFLFFFFLAKKWEGPWPPCPPPPSLTQLLIYQNLFLLLWIMPYYQSGATHTSFLKILRIKNLKIVIKLSNVGLKKITLHFLIRALTIRSRLVESPVIVRFYLFI